MKSFLALDRAAGHKKICINILFTKDGSQNDRSMYSPKHLVGNHIPTSTRMVIDMKCCTEASNGTGLYNQGRQYTECDSMTGRCQISGQTNLT